MTPLDWPPARGPASGSPASASRPRRLRRWWRRRRPPAVATGVTRHGRQGTASAAASRPARSRAPRSSCPPTPSRAHPAENRDRRQACVRHTPARTARSPRRRRPQQGAIRRCSGRVPRSALRRQERPAPPRRSPSSRRHRPRTIASSRACWQEQALQPPRPLPARRGQLAVPIARARRSSSRSLPYMMRAVGSWRHGTPDPKRPGISPGCHGFADP